MRLKGAAVVLAVASLAASGHCAQTETIDGWEITEKRDPFTDARTVTFAKSAWTGRSCSNHTPAAVVRCKDQKVELFIVTGCGDAEVAPEQKYLVRYGSDEPVERYLWSLDGGQIIKPHSAEHLLTQWITHDDFAIKVPRSNGGTTDIGFQTSGLRAAIQSTAMAEQCEIHDMISPYALMDTSKCGDELTLEAQLSCATEERDEVLRKFGDPAEKSRISLPICKDDLARSQTATRINCRLIGEN